VLVWLGACGVVAAVGVVVVVAARAGMQPYQAVGDADPGVVVRVGAPLLRLVTDLAACGCTGALGFVIFLTRPQHGGSISGFGYAQLRAATTAASVWCVGALALVPFSAADASGVSLATASAPAHLGDLFVALEQPRAWLVSAGCAVVVAVGCRLVLSWRLTVGLFVVSVLALLPPLVTGHGSSDENHDVAIGAIVVHVPAVAVWLGVLVAFVRHVRRRDRIEPDLLARYRSLATGCLLTVVASGVVLGAALISPARLIDSGYGVLLVAKFLLVTALCCTGLAWRGCAVRTLTDDAPGRRGIGCLLGGELVLLLAVLGLSVGLTHLPVPGFLSRLIGTQGTLLGYQLGGPPSLWRLMLDWRIEPLFGSLAVVLAASYLVAVARVRRQGGPWAVGRTASWLGGCAVLLLATCSGVGRYAPAMFSVHIAAHMMLSMLAPVLWALGGPLTMLRTSLGSAAGSSILPGCADWLAVLDGSPLARALTHPLVATALFAGSPFGLYFTGLFDVLVRFHWGHLAIDGWFIVIGYLFAWPIVGVDPTPRPLPNLARLGMLLAAMPADILFAALIIDTPRVIGNGMAAAQMYQALHLPWVPHLLADQRLAGILALVIGELALLGMIAVLLVRWGSFDDWLYHHAEAPARPRQPHPDYRDAADNGALDH
jgi:putative copper resistance protein D